jgi:hypothetical protein
VPTTDAQASVADTLDAIDDLAKAADAEVATLEHLRSAMLSALLSGIASIPASYDRFLIEAA